MQARRPKPKSASILSHKVSGNEVCSLHSSVLTGFSHGKDR